jgi:AraC-like DNA-binding protein
VSLHKVMEAAQLLATTELTVLEVAMRVGFGCLDAFEKSFKKTLGAAPRQFRNICRMPIFSETQEQTSVIVAPPGKENRGDTGGDGDCE